MRPPGAGKKFVNSEVIAVSDTELFDLIANQETNCISPEFIADHRKSPVPDTEYEWIFIPVYAKIQLHNTSLVSV